MIIYQTNYIEKNWFPYNNDNPKKVGEYRFKVFLRQTKNKSSKSFEKKSDCLKKAESIAELIVYDQRTNKHFSQYTVRTQSGIMPLQLFWIHLCVNKRNFYLPLNMGLNLERFLCSTLVKTLSIIFLSENLFKCTSGKLCVTIAFDKPHAQRNFYPIHLK